MPLRNTPQDYGAVAKFLHWRSVILIIAQYLLAEAADELDDGPDKFAIIANHKSTGMLILLLALARIGWKLANRGLPQPVPMARPQRIAAAAGHGILYLLLLVLPWQTLGGMPTVTHEHDGAGLPTSAGASVATSGDEHTHHAGHQQRANAGVTSAYHGESVPNDATPDVLFFVLLLVFVHTQRVVLHFVLEHFVDHPPLTRDNGLPLPITGFKSKFVWRG